MMTCFCRVIPLSVPTLAAVSKLLRRAEMSGLLCGGVFFLPCSSYIKISLIELPRNFIYPRDLPPKVDPMETWERRF